MKTLILLLLLSTMAWGQGTYDTSTGSYTNSTVKLLIQFDDKGCKIEKAITFNDIIRAWDSYVKECYADSEQISGWVFVTGKKNLRGFAAGHDEYKTWWEHRDPNNLSNWMEFLRRKVK